VRKRGSPCLEASASPEPERVGQKVLGVSDKSQSLSTGEVGWKRWTMNKNLRAFRPGRFQGWVPSALYAERAPCKRTESAFRYADIHQATVSWRRRIPLYHEPFYIEVAIYLQVQRTNAHWCRMPWAKPPARWKFHPL